MNEDRTLRVMISSTMIDLPYEREIAERVITEMGLTPWYAERPPSELTGSPYDVSRDMARGCDLYLLIIGSRYGSHPKGMPEDDSRSVTHLEFDIARTTPRKVRVFLPKDVDNLTDSEHPDAFRTFVAQVTDFRNGYDAFTYSRADLRTLAAEIRHAITQWLDTAGRDAYCVAVRDAYSKERNPVTGAEMDADATVLLKLRAEVARVTRGADWDEQRSEEDGQRAGGPAERRGRRGRREEEPRVDERIRMRAQPSSKPAGDFLTQFGRLVLLGEVGAGKSTLLRRLAYDLARDALAAQEATPRRIPMLVRATDLGQLALERPDARWSEIVGLLAERLTPDTSRKPLYHDAAVAALDRGDALLLVDGLDEAQPAEQQVVFALLRQVGANQTILASRPAAYSEELAGAGWRVCQAQRLDRTQRHALIAEVFRVVGESGARTERAQGSEATGPSPGPAALERELTQRDDLFTWVGNPLLLTLIATQYARDARLPESRARMYQFAIEDMRRQRVTSARRYFTEEELDRLQWALALRMTEMGARLTTLEEVRDRYLNDLLRELAPGATPGMAMLDACGREVLDRSGVLQQVDAERWEFIHLSFREYLAACALAALPRRERWRALRTRTLSAQWEQVFLLLVSRLDASRRPEEADALINALLAADDQRIPALGGTDPTHLALRLASRCALARGNQTSEQTQERLRAAWWRLWRAEERRYRGVSEGMAIVLTFDDEIDDDATIIESTPAFLAQGLPVLFARVFPARSSRRPPGWWGYGVVGALSALALLTLVGQLTLSVSVLAHSGWGRWLGAALPLLTLGTLGALMALRLYGLRVRSRWVRRELLLSVLGATGSAQALGQLRDGRAVEPLLAILHDDYSSSVRVVAAEALGRLGDGRAVEPLLVVLRDAASSYRVRQAVVETLGRLGDGRAVEPLLVVLRDADSPSDVRRAVAEALGQLRDGRAVEPLLAILHDDRSSVVRAAVAEALGRLGDARAVEPLLATLRDADSPSDVRQAVRAAVAQALGRLGDGRAVEPLLATLHDDRFLSDVRAAVTVAVVETLGRLGDGRAVEPLLAILHDDRFFPDVRAAAAEALGRLGDARAVEPLLATLRDDRFLSDVRAAVVVAVAVAVVVVEALGRLGDARAVEPLLAILHDDRFFPDVRAAAAEALGRLGDGRAVEPLLVVLRGADASYRVRAAAAEALGQLGDARAVEPLLATLRDADSPSDVRQAVRAAVAQALGRLGDGRAVEPLLATLRAADWRERLAALALRWMGAKRTVELLLATGRETDSNVRLAAAQALGQLGDGRAVEPLVAVLRAADSSSNMRAAAVEALGQLGDKRAVEPLVRRARRRAWSWALPPLALLHGLTDWPLLLTVLLAQVVLLIPQLSRLLPPSVLWLLACTAWWQALLLIVIFAVGYVGSWWARGAILFNAQANRDDLFEAAERLIRQHVVDTTGKTGEDRG